MKLFDGNNIKETKKMKMERKGRNKKQRKGTKAKIASQQRKF